MGYERRDSASDSSGPPFTETLNAFSGRRKNVLPKIALSYWLSVVSF
jgi:hypothetical protein